MKSASLIIASALLSSILTITVYSNYFPQRILIREPKSITTEGGTTNSRSVFVESDVSKPDEEVNEINAKFKSVDAFPSFREGSKRAIPTVVHIKSTEVRTNRYGYEYLDHSSGSGVIVSSDGYIAVSYTHLFCHLNIHRNKAGLFVIFAS